jgi:dethiobiotin synthetase
MKRYFVTATGTGVGKTFVTASLTHRAREIGQTIQALKPIVSGYDDSRPDDSDPAVLACALGHDLTGIETISPWRFQAPLSPDMAAAREGRSIDFDELTAFCRRSLVAATDIVLVEGVGGVMVPLTRRETVLDWMLALDIPVILVTGSYLGTISHTLTAMRVLSSAEITVRAIVLDESAPPTVSLIDTIAVLERFIPDVPIISVERRTDTDAWRDVPALWPLLI